jgi:hypothetical protein
MDELKPVSNTRDTPEVMQAVALRYGPQMDQQMDADLKTLSRFFLKHPSLAFTFGYLIASVMGLIFTISLLDEFQFNALPYLELTDFLLAAITHPMTVFALLLGVVFVIGFTWIDRRCRTKYPKYAAWIDNYYRSSIWLPNWLAMSILAVGYIWVAGNVQVDTLGRDIKAHQTGYYQLSLIYPIQPGGKEIRQLNEVQIITRTVSYLWIYHQDQVKLIPHANVAALIPVLPRELHQELNKALDKKPEQKAAKPAVAQEAVVKEPAAVPVKN